LQDAGILPVDVSSLPGMGGEVAPGARPRGVSATIPQEAIDDMLREHPAGGSDQGPDIYD